MQEIYNKTIEKGLLMKRMTIKEINDKIPQLHAAQLDLLLKLDAICKEHDIKYYLAFGSCIGAIRHKGFIPWDDDIDVLMSIDDVERFEKYANEGKYKLLTWKNGSNFNSIASWFVNSETTCVIEENVNIDIYQAVAIDIYPFYNAPKGRFGLIINVLRAHLYTLLVLGKPPQNHGRIVRCIGKFILNIYKKNRIKKALSLEKKLRSVPFTGSILDYFGHDISLFDAITYPYKWFGEPKSLEFEGHKVMGPADPDKYLRKRYGDYMIIPPKTEQISNLNNYIFLDTSKGYRGKWID